MASKAAANAIRVALRGEAILTHPRFNKSTAFSLPERKDFGLTGRLPYRVNTLEEQCRRAYDQLQSRDTPIRKNTFLQSLRDQNWVLYYGLIQRHLKELVPIIYTPTQGEAIANYSHLFRRSEGMFLTYANEDTMEEDFLEQTRGHNVQLFVVSDAEAILGIGDQGVGGIGISTAKSALYTLVGGISPHMSRSVVLDVGTNNEELLNDELYVGWPHKRVRGADYDRFVDKFVQLVRKHYPHSLLHFEDFGVGNARRLLDKYRDQHAVFNDDVQGTGAVTLAAIMSAVGVTKSKLADQRIVVFGAGSAGLGIARQIRDGMVTLDHIKQEDATRAFYLIDRHGLITQSLGSNIGPGQEEFARPAGEWDGAQRDGNGEIQLLEVVKKVKPTVLIGCSTKTGAFSEEVVREMAKHVERPVIMPLSNPGRLAEVEPRLANDWTEGRALMATGSPFPPCRQPNGKEYIIAECNNALIYPGLGFGTMITQSRSMTDRMIIAGTQRLAALAPALKDPDLPLLPDFHIAPHVNFEVAVAVAEQAIEEGCAGVEWKKSEVRSHIEAAQWQPFYKDFVHDPNGLH
ncbi:NAD-dependent malic enzyme [Phanerochaete sordida]|uniref:Malic enzyme n=1 Tax=Phanerochaete sordida TaxID=48140 RepID=A0A9P3LCJ2_9APHY|nr:NAD-dependent malic enzyme [Phanerochaete sordida]